MSENTEVATWIFLSMALLSLLFVYVIVPLSGKLSDKAETHKGVEYFLKFFVFLIKVIVGIILFLPVGGAFVLTRQASHLGETFIWFVVLIVFIYFYIKFLKWIK